jgi:hypothetical protein
MKTKLRFFVTSALLAVLTIGNGQLVHHARAADATALTFRTAIRMANSG